jgi:hypothetical protein
MKTTIEQITLKLDQLGFPIVINPADIVNPSRTIRILLGDSDSNTKLRKSLGYGFQTTGLSLAPHKLEGFGNVCPNASSGCIGACVAKQGLGAVFPNIEFARISKRVAWSLAREWFLETLIAELTKAERKAEKKGDRLAVRLNMFSDIPWEKFGIIDSFPNVQFYDYTKNPKRVGLIRPNYWVTFSRDETPASRDFSIRALKDGHNVAIAFDTGRVGARVSMGSCPADFPKTWYGFPVIDGDTTDLRFDDPRGRTKGRVVGLRLKSSSWAERQGALDSGFAISQTTKVI